jgi:hypothetical protein
MKWMRGPYHYITVLTVKYTCQKSKSKSKLSPPNPNLLAKAIAIVMIVEEGHSHTTAHHM